MVRITFPPVTAELYAPETMAPAGAYTLIRNAFTDEPGNFGLDIISANILEIDRRGQRQRKLEEALYIKTVGIAQGGQVKGISARGEDPAEGELDEDSVVTLLRPHPYNR